MQINSFDSPNFKARLVSNMGLGDKKKDFIDEPYSARITKTIESYDKALANQAKAAIELDKLMYGSAEIRDAVSKLPSGVVNVKNNLSLDEDKNPEPFEIEYVPYDKDIASQIYELEAFGGKFISSCLAQDIYGDIDKDKILKWLENLAEFTDTSDYD